MFDICLFLWFAVPNIDFFRQDINIYSFVIKMHSTN